MRDFCSHPLLGSFSPLAVFYFENGKENYLSILLSIKNEDIQLFPPNLAHQDGGCLSLDALEDTTKSSATSENICAVQKWEKYWEWLKHTISKQDYFQITPA